MAEGEEDDKSTDGSDDLSYVHRRSINQLIRNKKKQTSLTLKWLEDNYCVCEGVCLPRCILYAHYQEFCRRHKLEPACAATFGKTIRQKFPHLTTRRLGTRGHSKYHYYGIGIKESSEYYHTINSAKGLTRFSGAKMNNEGGFTRKYSLSSKTGTLLPEFLDASAFLLPSGLPIEKVETFLMMYKTHCQCILDTAITGNFEEIQSFLLHFWQGMPEHLLPLIENQVIIDIIAACDWILYKTLNDVLIPATMQEMPESMLCNIRNLGRHWEEWVLSSLDNLADAVVACRLPPAKIFAQTLQRQVSFLHLAQTARPLLYDAQQVKAIIDDVDAVDLAVITSHALYTAHDDQQNDDDDCTKQQVFQINAEFLQEFKEQLRKQASVEGFIEWLDIVVEQKILKPCKQKRNSKNGLSQDFLLKWFFFGARIEQSMTLNNASSFAAFHVIRMLLDEYVLLAIESQFVHEQETELQDTLAQYLNPQEAGKQLASKPTTCFLAKWTSNQPSMFLSEEDGEDERRGRKPSFNAFNAQDRVSNRHTVICHQEQGCYHEAPASELLTPPVSPVIATRGTVINRAHAFLEAPSSHHNNICTDPAYNPRDCSYSRAYDAAPFVPHLASSSCSRAPYAEAFCPSGDYCVQESANLNETTNGSYLQMMYSSQSPETANRFTCDHPEGTYIGGYASAIPSANRLVPDYVTVISNHSVAAARGNAHLHGAPCSTVEMDHFHNHTLRSAKGSIDTAEEYMTVEGCHSASLDEQHGPGVDSTNPDAMGSPSIPYNYPSTHGTLTNFL